MSSLKKKKKKNRKRKRKMVNNHQILNIRIRTCTGFQLKLAMLAFRTKGAKKAYS